MSKQRRLTLPKVRPPIKGYSRKWYVCTRCGRKAHYDYVPYSLSTAIAVSPCGHSFREDYEQFKPRESRKK